MTNNLTRFLRQNEFIYSNNNKKMMITVFYSYWKINTCRLSTVNMYFLSQIFTAES